MKTRIIAAALAAFFMLPLFGITAFAVELDGPEETPIVNESPVTDYPETPPRAFTPYGTGTVIDYATDTDGKVFYTIMTPFIAVIVILGGGAGWYYKIYRPKQQGAMSGGEYEPPVAGVENEYPGDWDDEQDESGDSQPWDEDENGDDE